MKKSILFAGFVVVAGIAALVYGETSGNVPADVPSAPSATVNVITLVQRSVPMRIVGSGSIVAGTAEMDVSLAAPGIVTGFMARPGQAVTAEQVLANVAPDPQSAAALRRAEDAVTAARIARDHVVALLARHLATTADVAAATQGLSDANATLVALRVSGTGENHTVTAPFAGIVTAIAAAPGGVLPAGTVLVKLAPAGRLTVLVGLSEAEALRVHAGDAAMLTSLNTGRRIPATVAQRAAMLDPQTGLMDVFLVPQASVALGEPVRVSITVGTVTGYLVPRAAVLSDEQGNYVYQLDAHDIAHREAANVLEADGAMSVLAPSLDPGTRIATTGAYQLSDGMAATLQGSGQGSGH
ncbi:efflux RND transporter periplasmic adaptor subunit [Acidocella sp.]|jgi:RND family efflux transporter MFP subunit|uniref:efflux RND transporter periplasmic adaptor subunit n=1 Tax=Acidocella sp. TaxID=50710 RepID=UPI002F42773C